MSDITKLGRTGLGMLGLYLTTTCIAVSVGLLLVNVIKPGEMADDAQRLRNRMTYELWVENTKSVEKPKDGRCLSCDPANKALVAEIFAAQQAASGPDEMVANARPPKQESPLQFLVDMVPSNIFLSFTPRAAPRGLAPRPVRCIRVR